MVRPAGKTSSYSRTNRPRLKLRVISLMKAAATGTSPPIASPWRKRRARNGVSEVQAVSARLATPDAATQYAITFTRP